MTVLKIANKKTSNGKRKKEEPTLLLSRRKYTNDIKLLKIFKKKSLDIRKCTLKLKMTYY